MHGRILVIEDDPENLDLMVYLLEAFGHKAFAARNGADGLVQAAREIPDLILCDVHMPGLDGFGAVSQFKSHPATRSVPVVAVTALAMVGDRELVLQAGFDGYLSKPIDPETFARQLEAWLPH